MGLFDRFRKDSVKDPFGGDDDEDFYEDEESSFSGSGPKIALAASGVVFATVVGLIGYVVLTAPESTDAVPLTGSLADLEIVEDARPAVTDATAATARSAERRPWLAAQAPPATNDRLGLDAKTKPTPPAAAKPAAPASPTAVKPAVAPPVATAAVTPPPTSAKPAAVKPTAPPAPVARETQVAVLPTPKVSPTGLKPVAPTPTVPAPATPALTAPAAAAKTAPTPPAPPEVAKTEPAADSTEEMPSVIAGIPALNAPGVAPGAPERFSATGDAGPPIAGGRPRLVDPPLPPTDRVAIAPPPPRFAALRDIRTENAPPRTAKAKPGAPDAAGAKAKT